MVDVSKKLIRPRIATSVMLFGLSSGLIAGCAVVENLDDPCMLANREPTFSVLVENSIANTYNACLAERREEIIAQWGQE